MISSSFMVDNSHVDGEQFELQQFFNYHNTSVVFKTRPPEVSHTANSTA